MKNFFLLVFIAFSLNSFSQDTIQFKKKQKGTFYFSWGYTRAWFSKSDIHFVDNSNNYHEATGRNNSYDFTIHDATAKDRPDFDGIPDVANLTVPQYAYRIGYYFNNKADIGIEGSFDHTKYIVTDYQRVRIKGQFNGVYVDKDTTLDPNSFLHFEHSDGANFLCFNFVKRWKFYNPSRKFNVGLIAKPGIGMVIPRTDVTLFGERVNNKFHIAGCIAAVEAGLRTEFFNNGFFEFTAKGSYANYMYVLVTGAGNGRANHSFYTLQLTAQLGLRIGGKNYLASRYPKK
jgi:hypothetical protein